MSTESPAPARRLRRWRWALLGFLIVGYLVAYHQGRQSLGAQSPVAIASAIPVAVAAWWWGRAGGLLLAATFFPIHAALAIAANPESGLQFLRDPPTLAGSVALLVVGWAVGWGREVDWQKSAALRTSAGHEAESRRLVEATHRRLQYERAIVECSRILLQEDHQLDLESALRGLAAATGADFVIVERNVDREDVGLCSRPLIWVSAAEGRSDAGAYWEDAPWSKMPMSFDALSHGKVHAFSWLSQLPPVERAFYEASDPPILSELDIPIMVDGRWSGLIGFAQLSEGRVWDDVDVELLQTVADMIGSLWARQAARQRLQEALAEREEMLRFEHALAACSASLLKGHSDSALERAVAATFEASDAAIVYVEENVDHPDLGPCTRTVHNLLRPGAVAAGQTPDYYELAPWSTMPDTAAALAAHQPFVFSDLDEVGEVERAFYLSSAFPTRAEINYPVVVDGRWVGLVGLADIRPRAWSERETRLVEAVADMIGSFWERNRSARRLEQLVRAKDQFIASVSHELRTPLSVVVGLAAELRDQGGSFDSWEAREFISLIAQQGSEVAHIVEDLLVAARAGDETVLTVFPEAIDLGAEVEQVLSSLPDDLRLRVRSNGHRSAPAWADPLRVRQIVRNLLVNAHRYGGEAIELAMVEDGDVVRLRVSDNGPGIPPERREDVFAAYRSGQQVAGRTPSIGLGLTVSRHLARLMRGDVTYRFDGLSTFEVTLPRSAA